MTDAAFWYLWRLEAANDYMPVSIGCLRITPDDATVVACEDAAFLAVFEELKGAKALEYRQDRTVEEDGATVIATYELVARKGEPAWPEALVRNLAAATGVRLTPTPSPY